MLSQLNRQVSPFRPKTSVVVSTQGRDLLSRPDTAWYPFRLGPRNKPQRCRIHAVAEMRRLRPVIENVSEVSVTLGAGNCGADHAVGQVSLLRDVFLGDRRPETRPARSRVEFRRRVEQRVVTANAAVDSFVVLVPAVLITFATRTFLGCSPESENRTISTSFALPAGLAASRMRGFLHCQNAKPATAAVMLARKKRRRTSAGPL